jgi:hypothetical protein
MKHIKGKYDQVVDELSGRDHKVHISSIIMFNKNLKDRILEVANLDQQYVKIK